MPTLAEELKNLRALKGWTLRQAEKKTKGKVSNSYLYQLENGAVKEPSPHILYELATAYGASYAGLMTLAGYFVPQRTGKTAGHQSVAFNAMDLSSEEQQEVLDYVKFQREQRKKKSL